MIASYGYTANRASHHSSAANGGSDGSELSFDELPLPCCAARLLTLLYQRPQLPLYREQVSSLYTFGYVFLCEN